MFRLRLLRPGLDFMDSVQAWQGQHDDIQLARSKVKKKKTRGADLFVFSHVALRMLLLASGSCSLF